MLSAQPLLLLTYVSLVWAEKSLGCKDLADPDEFKGLKNERSIQFQGRDVWVSFPPDYRTSKPASLIIGYHDLDMTTKDMAKLTFFSNPKVNRNAIVIYPSAKDGYWMTDPLSGFKPQEDSFDSEGDDDPSNDLFYTAKLIDHFQSTLCINNRRVYAVGLGTGGGMIHQLACQPQLSRKIAAYAAIGGAFYKSTGKDDYLWGNCRIGRRPIPILEIHGDEDDQYPLAPSKKVKGDILSTKEFIKDWQDLNRCGKPKGDSVVSKNSETTVLTELEYGQKSESLVFGGGAIKESYRCGHWPDRENDIFVEEEKDQGKLSLVHYTIYNFNHGWPRMTVKQKKGVLFKGKMVKPIGNPNIDATSIVLNFFNHHRLPNGLALQSQMRMLMMERGAPTRDGKNLPKDIPLPKDEL